MVLSITSGTPDLVSDGRHLSISSTFMRGWRWSRRKPRASWSNGLAEVFGIAGSTNLTSIPGGGQLTSNCV